MSAVASIGKRSSALYSVTEGALRDTIRLRSASDGYFSARTDSLDGKDDSGFLGLHRHGVVVELWRVES